MQLICPLCRAKLCKIRQSWCCENQHSFDIAREGYTHLLPVQKKKSRAPGDDKLMVSARKRFLDAGYYQVVSDAINQMAQQLLRQQPGTSVAIIDAGCGEGYYSTRLQQALHGCSISNTIVGVDISKYACKAAAKRSQSIEWLVASSSDMPIARDSADLILSLFSPIPAEEFKRCLKPGGQLIVASTGPQHLLELRELVYDKVNRNSLDTDALLVAEFSPDSDQQLVIDYQLNLQGSATLEDLLAMTPHFWRVSAEKKSRLKSIEALSVRVDVRLTAYSPC